MWSDTSHGQSFLNSPSYSNSPGIDRLCIQSRLGCVLAGGGRGGNVRASMSRNNMPLQDLSTSSLPSPSQVSAEAAIFVAVIVVFYAAIIVILLGTNMRRPSSPTTRRSRRRSRSRSRSRHRHQVVLDPSNGSVSTHHVPSSSKKAAAQASDGLLAAENV